MDIEIKEVEHCKLSVHYVADAGEILNKRGEILKAFKKAPVPGFRKGKASLDAIKMHYRDQIEESVKRSLAEDAYHNTLFEKKLRPHGAPKFNSLLMVDGKFMCDFDLAVKPGFELATYRDFELPKPHETITAVELTEKMMQELRVRFGTSVPYEENDFIQKGDNVIVDYVGTIDGQKIDNLSADGEMLTVGHSQLTIFDDNLLGMTIGETREFDLVVPADGLPSLVGKTIHFTVSLSMGAKNEPAPLNDELAAKVGKKDFAELKEFVAKSAAAKLSIAGKTQITNAISRVLVANHSFDVPNWLTLSEAKYLAHQSKMDWDTLVDIDRQKFMEMAESNVKLSLILDRIRDMEPEAQMSEQEVFEIIKQNIAQSQAQSQTKSNPDEIIQEMNRTGYLQILFSRIKDEYTLDFITKTIRFIE
jgi:trigger factor